MSPEIRISDADREAAITALGEHFASGRLTQDEYEERTTQAYAARTASALRPLFVDLPAPHPVLDAGPVGAAGRGSSARATSTAVEQRGSGRGRGRGFRLPLMPVLLVLIGVAILVKSPWVVFLGLGLLWLVRAGRHGCGGPRRYSSGSDRAARGRWT